LIMTALHDSDLVNIIQPTQTTSLFLGMCLDCDFIV